MPLVVFYYRPEMVKKNWCLSKTKQRLMRKRKNKLASLEATLARNSANSPTDGGKV